MLTVPEHWSRPEEEVVLAVGIGILRVSDDGSVWRLGQERARPRSGGRVFIPCEPRRAERWAADDGYGQVRVMVDGRRYAALAHRLVWRYAEGTIPLGLTVNHRDGNKRNNRRSNLELATPSEQAIHAHATGLIDQTGERNPACRFSDADIATVMSARAAGSTQAQAAALVGMSPQYVSNIERGNRRQYPETVTAS